MQLEKNRAFDILGIGDADIDIMVNVKNFPEAGQKSSGRIIGKYPGGMVANLLSSATAFGAKCKAVLCTGEDAFGELSLNDLRKRGIDITETVIRKGEDTYFTTTCIGADGEKRMILCFGNAIYPTADEVSDEALKSARIVQMTGSHTKLTLPISKRAHKFGTIVSYDLERLQSPMNNETKREIIASADIVFPNEEGLFSYIEAETIEEAAHRILNEGPKIVIVTKGSHGAELFTKTEHYKVPAFNVPVKDTTGAGDTFNGAFLAAMCQNHSLKDSLTLASAAAAMQITEVGSRTKLISLEEAMRFVSTHQDFQ